MSGPEGQSANERGGPVQLVGVRGTCGSMQASMPAQSGAIMLDASCRCASSKHLCGEQAQALALLAPCQWQSGKAAAPQRAGQCGRKGRVFGARRLTCPIGNKASLDSLNTHGALSHAPAGYQYLGRQNGWGVAC